MASLYDFLKDPQFKGRIKEADAYAEVNGTDKWGTRILWISLTFGPKMARRYGSKHNSQSPPWKRFHRLMDLGVLSLDPEGIVSTGGEEPWESDTLLWFDTLVAASAGEDLPAGFPTLKRGQ